MANKISTVRLRIGILIWVISYMPFPVVILAIEHSMGNFTTPTESGKFLFISYLIQFLIGFVGLFMAGSETIKLIKHSGWRPLPRNLIRVVLHGKLPPET